MVRAEVSVDLNYDRITENDEVFDPDGQVVRSTQTVDENASDGGPRRRAGHGGEQPAGGRGGPRYDSGASSRSQNAADRRNHELRDLQERDDTGARIRRGRAPDRRGPGRWRPQRWARTAHRWTTRHATQEELQQLAALVRNAVGYDESRGDQVEVVNMRFADVETPRSFEEDGGFLGLSKSDYFQIAEILLFMIIAVLVISAWCCVRTWSAARSPPCSRSPSRPCRAWKVWRAGALEGPEAPMARRCPCRRGRSDDQPRFAVEGQIQRVLRPQDWRDHRQAPRRGARHPPHLDLRGINHGPNHDANSQHRRAPCRARKRHPILMLTMGEDRQREDPAAAQRRRVGRC